MAKISQDEVKHLAQLAKIALAPADIPKFQKDLEQILGYVERLQAVDTTGVAPTSQVTGLVDVSRSDEVKAQPDREELLKNAPDQQAGQIKVKRVLE